MKYTKDQKKAYFKKLRDEWLKSKDLAKNDKEAEAIYREAGIRSSYYSFYFTLMAMRHNKMPGLPYVDCKTFNKWKENGFIVKKGEKSKISGITWKHPVIKTEDGLKEENEDYIYPKLYRLFHKRQVEAL